MPENEMYESEVSVQGLKTTYCQKPGGDIPLLIVHGWCQSKERWLSFAKSLGERFRTVIPDLPGFGDSDKPVATYDLQFFQDFLYSFCSAIDFPLADSFVIGHSMGGSIALALASAYRPRKVILVDAPLAPHWLAKAATLLGPISSPLFALGRRSDLLASVFAGLTVSDTRFIDPLLIDDARKPTPQSAVSALKAVSTTDLKTMLAELRSRTLLIHGTRDRMVDYRQYESLDVLRNKQVSIAPMTGAGHMPFVEQPLLFRSICMNFLDDGAKVE